MTRFLYILCVVLSTAALSAAWFLAGNPQAALSILALMPLQLLFKARGAKIQHIPGIFLVILVLLSAAGQWSHLNLSLSLAAVICALLAWDLQEFSQRLTQIPPEDHPLQVERTHLLRLAIFVIASLTVNLISLTLHLHAGFEWTLALAALAFLGIDALLTALKPRGG